MKPYAMPYAMYTQHPGYSDCRWSHGPPKQKLNLTNYIILSTPRSRDIVGEVGGATQAVSNPSAHALTPSTLRASGCARSLRVPEVVQGMRT